jgi:hypothetical protein
LLDAGLTLLGELLPQQRWRLTRLAREAPVFADLIRDYAAAREALERFERTHTIGPEPRISEYRALTAELEDEVRSRLQG